jgi:uncharacterized protein (TIGR00255 family)
MLLSMTGQGTASCDRAGARVEAEIRSVNHRHLKIQARLAEPLQRLEGELERLVQTVLRRGSLQVNLRLTAPAGASSICINQPRLQGLLDQLQQLKLPAQLPLSAELGSLLRLPDMLLSDQQPDPEAAEELLLCGREAVLAALEQLQLMRRQEGEAMLSAIVAWLDQMEQLRRQIASRAAELPELYRQRLLSRIQEALGPAAATISSSDLLREVCLYADRYDVQEELLRLGSHFDQFRQLLEGEAGQGRKLDFLVQELFREVNTIGSKSSDSQITLWVVELKTTLEQIRELVQNVE